MRFLELVVALPLFGFYMLCQAYVGCTNRDARLTYLDMYLFQLYRLCFSTRVTLWECA